MYQVEKDSGYVYRPSSFANNEGYLDAANIWLHSYRHILDVRAHLGENLFRLLEVETLNSDLSYVHNTFDFLGLDFDEKAYIKV